MKFARRRRLPGDLAALISDSEDLRPGWEQIVNNFVEKVVNNSINHLRHPFYETHYAVKAAPILDWLTLQVAERQRGIPGNVIFLVSIELVPKR